MDIQNSLDFYYARLKFPNPETITTNMTCVCPWLYNLLCCLV